ncbi:uncharacterized protein RBU33_007525 [Hipposideros larvatus]
MYQRTQGQGRVPDPSGRVSAPECLGGVETRELHSIYICSCAQTLTTTIRPLKSETTRAKVPPRRNAATSTSLGCSGAGTAAKLGPHTTTRCPLGEESAYPPSTVSASLSFKKTTEVSTSSRGDSRCTPAEPHLSLTRHG